MATICPIRRAQQSHKWCYILPTLQIILIFTEATPILSTPPNNSLSIIVFLEAKKSYDYACNDVFDIGMRGPLPLRLWWLTQPELLTCLTILLQGLFPAFKLFHAVNFGFTFFSCNQVSCSLLFDELPIPQPWLAA